MTLSELWFALIAVLWIGYIFLEGFDFGVGILLPVLGRDDTDRRMLINSIGPVWDGNEVWLLTAGGATFAAFPEWYATLFSGFYLALFLILVALIVRGVAFEYRSKSEDPTWRKRWDWAIFVSSVVPALLWGVAFANIVAGTKIGADHEYAGGFFDLLNPYALMGGVMTLLVFTLHGALFLTLKNTGDLHDRAMITAKKVAVPAIGVAAAWLLWTFLADLSDNPAALFSIATAVTACAAIAALLLTIQGRTGFAFASMGVTILSLVATLFIDLFPRVMPSSINKAFSLTVYNASSTSYTLKVMTVVALVMVPIVLGYQIWTYWIFRKRLVRPVDVA